MSERLRPTVSDELAELVRRYAVECNTSESRAAAALMAIGAREVYQQDVAPPPPHGDVMRIGRMRDLKEMESTAGEIELNKSELWVMLPDDRVQTRIAKKSFSACLRDARRHQHKFESWCVQSHLAGTNHYIVMAQSKNWYVPTSHRVPPVE